MAPNTNPPFVKDPRIGIAQIATANTNRDGTGTIGTVLTAGTYGTRVHRIIIKATGTTTAGMIRVFIHDGTNYRLYREIAVTAATPSGTVMAFEYILDLQNEDAIILPTAYSIRASTHNAETFNVFAEGGDY